MSKRHPKYLQNMQLNSILITVYFHFRGNIVVLPDREMVLDTLQILILHAQYLIIVHY